MNRLVVWLLLGLAFSGCARASVSQAAGRPNAITGEELTLLPVETLSPDFQWRQRVTATWSEGERSFSAVMTKTDGLLRLVGLDPMGRVGFSLSLRDGKPIELESHPSVQFPFDPRFILLDVQRVFYPWTDGSNFVDSGGEKPDKVALAGTLVEDRLSRGRLVKRRFFDEEHPQELVASVDYSYTGGVEGVADEVIYRNLRHGYQLVIATLDAQYF